MASRFVTLCLCSRWVYYVEYLLVVGLWWLYRLMPLRLAYRFGWRLGTSVFALFRWERRMRVAIDNVVVAGLAKTRAEAYRIARDSIWHFVGHTFDALRASDVLTQDNWRDYVEIEMTPAAQEMLFSAKEPIILATGHLGAWEAGITAITSVRPMFAVARLMDNPYIQRFLERHNFRGGATIIPKKHGFRGSALRQWKDTCGALTILFDQFSSGGVMVPFFGHIVPVYTSPARLHLHTGAPVLVGGFLRTGLLRYKLVAIGDPILLQPGATQETLTAEFIARLERVIRMAPDQYLWLHRRFRRIPVPTVPER